MQTIPHHISGIPNLDDFQKAVKRFHTQHKTDPTHIEVHPDVHSQLPDDCKEITFNKCASDGQVKITVAPDPTWVENYILLSSQIQ